MSNLNIMVIGVNHRIKNAAEVQKTLTQNGCMIKVRLGMHEHIERDAGESCSPNGLIILQLVGSPEGLRLSAKN